MDLLQRAGVVAALIGLGLLLRWAGRRWTRRRAERALTGTRPNDEHVRLYYFWSPACHVCRTTQKPIVEAVLAEPTMQSVLLHSVDVASEPDLAREWGVLTVPTTFIVDRQGRCLETNPGLINRPRLQSQLERALSKAVGTID